MFMDYLADSLDINKRQKYTVNLRYKDENIADANNFMNVYKVKTFLSLKTDLKLYLPIFGEAIILQ